MTTTTTTRHACPAWCTVTPAAHEAEQREGAAIHRQPIEATAAYVVEVVQDGGAGPRVYVYDRTEGEHSPTTARAFAAALLRACNVVEAAQA